jgi:hypothetical protein
MSIPLILLIVILLLLLGGFGLAVKGLMLLFWLAVILLIISVVFALARGRGGI